MPRMVSAPRERHNFHVPLPHDLYIQLQTEARRQKQSANALAREAISNWLRARHKELIDAEVQAYAMAVAGSADDLDPELEEATTEFLRDNP